MSKKILVISYNSNNPKSNIQKVLEAASNTRKLFETTWLIATTDTAAQLYTKLEPFLDKDADRIFIADVTNDRQGWLSRPIWEWIKEYLTPSS